MGTIVSQCLPVTSVVTRLSVHVIGTRRPSASPLWGGHAIVDSSL